MRRTLDLFRAGGRVVHLSCSDQSKTINAMIWNFEILYSDKPDDKHGHYASTCAVVCDRRLFGTLYSLLRPFLKDSFSSEKLHYVTIDDSAPELSESLGLLADAGFTPLFQAMVSPDQRGKHFPVRRDGSDFSLDSSSWLRLMDAGNDGGEVLSFRDNQLTARADKAKLKKKGHCLNLLWCEFAVSEDFKKSFEDAGLRGAVFRPLIYDPPAPKCPRQFWMDTDYIAPWSLDSRRITWTSGKDMAGIEIGRTNEPLMDLQDGDLIQDSAGYRGAGATYRNADLAPFEGVDFMRQAEWFRVRNGIWRSYHLVSQRFRVWAKKFGCRFMMNGVKLK